MSDEPNSPIHSPDRTQDPENNHNHKQNQNGTSNHVVRRERPSRACTARAAARLSAAVAAETTAAVRKPKKAKKEPVVREEEPPSPPPQPQCKIVTQLVAEPLPEQLPRWNIRSMSELGSILNFLNVFRPLLNIKVEFSAEEFETALITPNKTLGDVHMPLLKAIPPITRMALGHNTWVTVLCRKLRDWWHWVAEGELPIVASHGAEVEAYNALDPCVRVVILKALCDIRVEQEDIRNYIDDSIKHGAPLTNFRKERVGGDSYGISYWYEEDPIIGYRLYREIRRVDVKKAKGKNVQPIPNSSYQWETVATNLDEFQDVSEKLFSSVNRTEASLGKKLKNDMLEDIEKVHKRKERQLKKQQREGLLLDSMINVDGLIPGRSLRDRKPVTYTFDDYDRSINEAIKITKNRPPSPEPSARRELPTNADASVNGTTEPPRVDSFNVPSPMSSDYDDEAEMDHKPEMEMPGNRRRKRPQRYSAREYVETVSENEADSDSDDDIVGEVVYDDEYLKQRKRRRKDSSGSEEEYHWDEENQEEDEEEEEEEDDDDSDASASMSEDSDQPRKLRKVAGRTRRGTKVRSVDELQSGLRRSRRATRNRIDYKQYEASESEGESAKPEKSNASDEQTDPAEEEEEEEEGFSMGSQDFEGENNNPEVEVIGLQEDPLDIVEQEHEHDQGQGQPLEKPNGPAQDPLEGTFNQVEDGLGGACGGLGEDGGLRIGAYGLGQDGLGGGFDLGQGENGGVGGFDLGRDENGGVRKPRFLDLNELAPGSGFEDGPSINMNDGDDDDDGTNNNF